MSGREIILGLLGGLGLFLYGMHLMSDSLEKVAGDKLRGILEIFTKNRYVGIIVGTIFTGLVQSSSAATVMVVSFVNAGLMNLYQAAGVIYGANIGTTVTSQLVSFNLSEYAPAFILIGVILALFIDNPTIKKVGGVIVGFGILFLGLSTMKDSMSFLKESPTVTNMLASLTNPFFAVLLGTVITAVIQSSSVTVSIVLLMCSQGLLQLPICFFIILGCNIGSCGSALIASMSGKKDAKRAALIHFLFNIVGSAVMFILFSIGMPYVESFIYRISGNDLGRCVANAHTSIKILQVIMLLPFSNAIVKMTYKIIPGGDKKAEGAELKYIGEGYMMTSNTAIPQVVKEMNRMGKLVIENLDLALDALRNNDEEKANQVFETEETIDFLNKEITEYLIRAYQLNLSDRDQKALAGMFHVVSDIERIGDHAENIAEDAVRKKNQNLIFSEVGTEELNEMTKMVDQIMTLSLDMFTNHQIDNLKSIMQIEDTIDHEERKLQNRHIERLSKNQCSAPAGMMFSDLLSNLERVADHATNIAYSILDYNPEEEKSPKIK